MLYLNLSSDFNPFSSTKENTIKFDSFVFPGGEPHIKLEYSHALVEDNHNNGFIGCMITTRITSFIDVGILQLAVNALRRLYPIDEVYLYLPYFPGARQDRLCNEGEPLTCEVYADIINSLGFRSVQILDAHSDVAPALLNNVYNASNVDFVEDCVKSLNLSKMYLVIPDSGASKKAIEVAKRLEGIGTSFGIVKCDKLRDLATGNLTGFKCYANDLQQTDCVVVDDICDGGGTFLGIAKKLKEKDAGKLHLIVTHGIFSKGVTELEKVYDSIWCTNSIGDFEDDFEEGNMYRKRVWLNNRCQFSYDKCNKLNVIKLEG